MGSGSAYPRLWYGVGTPHPQGSNGHGNADHWLPYECLCAGILPPTRDMTALVTQCQADARHHGLTVLLLSPTTASRRLYERCGFQVAPYLEWETR